MNKSKVFLSLNEESIAEKINNAKEKIFYAAPGILEKIAVALINKQKEENVSIDIVIDPNPDICRLGYGDAKVIDMLMDSGISLRKTEGIRICLLIIDDEGWFFNLPPLCVEEPPNLTQINGIRLIKSQIDEMAQALGFNYLFENEKDLSKEIKTTKQVPEIGTKQVTKIEMKSVKKDLEERPPEKFDIKRKVNVYHSHVQFVDLHLDGCHLTRHTVKLPKELINVSWGKALKERVDTSLHLLSDSTSISTEKIQNKFDLLKKECIRSVGKDHGNIILIKLKNKFENGLNKIKEEIDTFKNEQSKNIKKEITKTKDLVVGKLLSNIFKNPPDDLKNSCLYDSNNKDEVKLWLEAQVEEILPKPEIFLSKMKIRYMTKDVTYETLKDENFQNKMEELFPNEKWATPLEEYKAVKQKEK